jgi:hypothetical protein
MLFNADQPRIRVGLVCCENKSLRSLAVGRTYGTQRKWPMAVRARTGSKANLIPISPAIRANLGLLTNVNSTLPNRRDLQLYQN